MKCDENTFWLYVFRNIDLCRKGCDFYNDVQIMNEQKEKLDDKNGLLPSFKTKS